MSPSTQKVPTQNVIDAGELLEKAIENISDAHSKILHADPETANELARISNELSKVCISLCTAGIVAEQTDRSPVPSFVANRYRTSIVKPASPPSLSSSLDETQEFAEKHLTTNENSRENAMQAPEYFVDTSLDTSQVSTQARAGYAGDKASQAQDLAMTKKTEPSPILAGQKTWAKVAELRMTEGKQPATAINLASGKMKTAVVLKKPASTQGLRPYPTEPSFMQRRVIFIRNCAERITIRKITASINEGPLMSIVLEISNDFPPQLACIIFYAAEHALAFREKMNRIEREEGRTLFGPQSSIVSGPLWPEDEDIRAMHPIYNVRETRRLTFAGPGFFSRVSRAVFVKDNEEVVGAQNVELVWLFNPGNATVIYTSVRVARAAKRVFSEKARKTGPYHGLKVEYSTDPCQKALKLVTQMHDGPETKGLALP